MFPLRYLSFDDWFANGFPDEPCYADLGMFDIPETLEFAIRNAPDCVKVLTLDWQAFTEDLKKVGAERGIVIVPKFASLARMQDQKLPDTEIERLTRELAEARRDVKRMDWLDDTGKTFGHGFCCEMYGDYTYYVHQHFDGFVNKTARQEIDDAMGEVATNG